MAPIQEQSHEDVRSRLLEYIRQMDRSLAYADDRMATLEQIQHDPMIVDYLSSDRFRKKQLKGKSDPLGESDPIMNLFDEIVYYLLQPAFNNQNHEECFYQDQTGQVPSNEQYPVLTKNKKMTTAQRERSIQIWNTKDEQQDRGYREYYNTVTDADLKKYDELRQIKLGKDQLYQRLGMGLAGIEKERKLHALVAEFQHKASTYSASVGVKESAPLYETASSSDPYRRSWDEQTYIRTAKRTYRDLALEMLMVKDQLTQPIRFKNISKSSGIYDYDYSYFNFSDVRQVAVVFKHYQELKARHYDRKDDIWSAIFDFDELILQVQFNPYEQFIYDRTIEGYKPNDIHKQLYDMLQTQWNELKVRRHVDEYIPRKIVNTYLELRDCRLHHVYREFLNPVYKRCSKCAQVKLASRRYFSPDATKKDRYKSICKKCRNPGTIYDKK